jgi:hypothetical protein
MMSAAESYIWLMVSAAESFIWLMVSVAESYIGLRMYIWVMTSSVKFGRRPLLLITSAVEEHTCLMSKTMRLKNVMFDIHCC